MYIISLVLAIIACITAFLPLYGVIFTILLSIISLLFSLINMHSNERKIKEISIISIVVCIFSFLICIGINIYTLFLAPNRNIEDVKFTTLSQDYPTFSLNEEVKNENFNFKIDGYSTEGNFLYLDYTMVIHGEERTFSAFDFYILDESTDDIYYITFENGSEYVYNKEAGNDETISGKLKFTLKENYNIDKLYLVYENEESSFKIKI